MKNTKPAERKLKKLRADIDRADEKLIAALAARFKAVTEVGAVKQILKLPPRQSKRWRELVAQRLARGGKAGLDKKLLTKIFAAIHSESLRIQKKIPKKLSRSS